jgi:hypothetical protein
MGKWIIAINISKSRTIIFAFAGGRFTQPRTFTLLGEPIQWVESTRYVAVTLDKRLTWSYYIDHVKKKTVRRMDILGPLLQRKCDVFVRNSVLLKKRPYPPVFNFVCPSCNCAARTNVRRLQVTQSKCFRLASGAPWYVSNRQVHESPSVPPFLPHRISACDLWVKICWRS